MVFQCAIRTNRVPSPPVDRVRLKYFELRNDRGYLFVPNNVYTPEANRLFYFDNTIKVEFSGKGSAYKPIKARL